MPGMGWGGMGWDGVGCVPLQHSSGPAGQGDSGKPSTPQGLANEPAGPSDVSGESCGAQPGRSQERPAARAQRVALQSEQPLHGLIKLKGCMGRVCCRKP